MVNPEQEERYRRYSIEKARSKVRREIAGLIVDFGGDAALGKITFVVFSSTTTAGKIAIAAVDAAVLGITALQARSVIKAEKDYRQLNPRLKTIYNVSQGQRK